MLKPAVLTDENNKNLLEMNKFPVRPLILLPSEVEFLLSYLAKDDDHSIDVINNDNEEDRSLLEENDANNVSELHSYVYMYIYICIQTYIHSYIHTYIHE